MRIVAACLLSCLVICANTQLAPLTANVTVSLGTTSTFSIGYGFTSVSMRTPTTYVFASTTKMNNVAGVDALFQVLDVAAPMNNGKNFTLSYGYLQEFGQLQVIKPVQSPNVVSLGSCIDAISSTTECAFTLEAGDAVAYVLFSITFVPQFKA